MKKMIKVKRLKNLNSNDDILKKLKESEKEIENNQGVDSDEFFKEMRVKYGY